MNSKLVDLLAPTLQNASKYKKISRLLRRLPTILKTYDYKLDITFNYLTPEQNINHAEYAKIFGHVREVMGLAIIPDFKQEIGKTYMLKTKLAHYELIADFYFGDTMIVKMFVTDLTTVSFCLHALYTDSSGKAKATGTQKIAYTDMNGKPCKMADKFYQAVENYVVKM